MKQKLIKNKLLSLQVPVRKLNEYTIKELKDLEKWAHKEFCEWAEFWKIIVDELVKRKEKR